MKSAITKPSKLPYVPELDGLRALAVLAVIAFHTIPAFVPGGLVGVDIFFVLSGFLVTRILVNEFESTGKIHFMTFYTRRCLRLMPALWLLLFVYIYFVLFCGGANKGYHLLAVLSAGTYFMNWTEAFHLGPQGFLSHTWSLALEAQFYLVFPIVLSLFLSTVKRRSLWVPFLLLVLLSTAWRIFLILSNADHDRIYFAFDTRVDTLLIGCLLATSPMDRLIPMIRRFWYVPVLSLLICVFCVAPFDGAYGPTHEWKPFFIFGTSFVAACAGWTIILIAECRDGRRLPFMSWKPIVYIGRISYGVYLWHWPIYLLLANHMPGPVTFAATATVSVFIASASFYLIEKPVLELKTGLSDMLWFTQLSRRPALIPPDLRRDGAV